MNQWAIVIPFYCNKNRLLSLLQQISQYKIIVVDDALEKTRFPQSFMEQQVSIVRTQGGEGFAKAVNYGLTFAQNNGYSHVLLLNDDAVPLPRCIDVLSKYRAKEIVGSILLGSEGIESAGISVSSFGRVKANYRIPKKLSEVDAVSGACMFFPSVLRFDETFRHGFEDIELCLRMKKEGYKILLHPDAKCWHEGGGTISHQSDKFQKDSVYGHLHLMNQKRMLPIVVGLSTVQVIVEKGPVKRLRAIFDGARDWIRDNPSYLFSLATRIASSNPGSKRAR